MPKKLDKSGYSSMQIVQLLRLIEALNEHSLAMQEPPYTIFFTLGDMQRLLSLTRYHAKKLACQCVQERIFHQEGLRYRLSVESPLFKALERAAHLSQ